MGENNSGEVEECPGWCAKEASYNHGNARCPSVAAPKTEFPLCIADGFPSELIKHKEAGAHVYEEMVRRTQRISIQSGCFTYTCTNGAQGVNALRFLEYINVHRLLIVWCLENTNGVSKSVIQSVDNGSWQSSGTISHCNGQPAERIGYAEHAKIKSRQYNDSLIVSRKHQPW